MGPARRRDHRRRKGGGMHSAGAVDAHGPHSMTRGHEHGSTPRALELLGKPSDGVPRHARGRSASTSPLGNTALKPSGARPF